MNRELFLLERSAVTYIGVYLFSVGCTGASTARGFVLQTTFPFACGVGAEVVPADTGVGVTACISSVGMGEGAGMLSPSFRGSGPRSEPTGEVSNPLDELGEVADPVVYITRTVRQWAD